MLPLVGIKIYGLTHITDFAVSTRDKVSNFQVSIYQYWQTECKQRVDLCRKGLFLRGITPVLAYWPWTSHPVRTIETIFAR